MFELFQFPLLADQIRKDGDTCVPDRAFELEIGFLRQIPDAQRLGAGHLTR